MLEDYSAQEPKMEWNTARGVWETTQQNLLCGHLEPFLGTWPTSGMMRDGRVYELRTQEPLINDSESSLLRTPTAQEAGGGLISPSVAKFKNQTLRLGGQIIDLVEPGRLPVVDEKTVKLLPTPNTMEHLPARTGEARERQLRRGDPEGSKRSSMGNLREDILDLMPTPTTRDYKDTSIAPAKHRPNDRDTLTRAIYHNKETNWGKYEQAIRVWEKVINRVAPQPTEPTGKNGQEQLSSKFTEWMMGLPEGWITDAGLKRADELKACGNGVVPQQAELALRKLLEGVDW